MDLTRCPSGEPATPEVSTTVAQEDEGVKRFRGMTSQS